MLTIQIHNDGTGDETSANYDVTTYINRHVIWTGRIKGFNRSAGWVGLIRAVAEEAYKDGKSNLEEAG